jgi:hypothetical protein
MVIQGINKVVVVVVLLLVEMDDLLFLFLLMLVFHLHLLLLMLMLHRITIIIIITIIVMELRINIRSMGKSNLLRTDGRMIDRSFITFVGIVYSKIYFPYQWDGIIMLLISVS